MNTKNKGLALLLALSALPISACNTGEARIADAQAESETAAMPVEIAYPNRADVFATYETTGALSSDDEAAVLAKVAGEVVDVLVEEGDLVESGQVLARLDGERLRLVMLQAKATLEKVSREYQRNVRLHEKGLVSAAASEDLKFDLDSLKAAYELAKLNYSYTDIRAPISGVISARDIKLGQHIDVNASTFKVVDSAHLIAYLKIPQNELAKFAAGHTSDLRVDAFPGEIFDATIARISPTVDTTNGTFRATAKIDNRSGQLAPGMFGRFSIAYEKHSSVLTIPASALIREDNIATVYVVEDGAAKRRFVQTGIEDGNVVEIVSGLEEGEQIVVTGQNSLREGTKVFANNAQQPFLTG